MAGILVLQRLAGNAAVTQAITVQRLWNRSGRALRPFSVNRGEGTHGNLKFNKGRSASGKKQFNTGFWCMTDDWRDQLHVHMGDAGGLTQSGGAHHFKYGDTYGITVSESDLETVFGSKNVKQWTKSTYNVP